MHNTKGRDLIKIREARVERWPCWGFEVELFPGNYLLVNIINELMSRGVIVIHSWNIVARFELALLINRPFAFLIKEI